jgi:ABC-type lipoprotein release transport system permease subunit
VAAAHFRAENQGAPGLEHASLRIRLVGLTELIRRDAERQGLLMFAGVLLLLLMAGANVINLMLARAANQQRSMAIRVALGAQPKHMFAAVLAEVLLLMSAACVLSLAVALGIVEVLKQIIAGQLPRLHELHLSGATLAFATAVALLLAITFTWLVNRQINYRSLNTMLQSSGKGAGLQISGRTRYLLILSQVALVGLLLTASLQVMWQSLREINQPLGFSIDNQYQVRFSVATLVANTSYEQRRIMVTQLQDILRENPKVKAVGLSSGSPVTVSGPFSQMLGLDGQENTVSAVQSFNDASFFEILGLRLVEGNFFSEQDNRTSQKVMLVNETLARRLQADGHVVEKIVRRSVDESSPDGIRIVGVVKDLHLPGQAEKPRFFQALITETPEFLIEVKPGQALTAIELNTIARSVSPQLKVAFMQTAQTSFDNFTARQTTAAGLTASLSVLALALAAIGIYGLLSYSVKLRRFELGVRMAVGATPASIFWQILRDNLNPIALGLFLACVVLTGLYYWVQRLSYQLETNWFAWILPWVLIIGLAAMASLMSVWQIIRHPANHVLRAD